MGTVLLLMCAMSVVRRPGRPVQCGLDVFGGRLFRKSAQPRADVQPASGLQTLRLALAGAVSLSEAQASPEDENLLSCGGAFGLRSREFSLWNLRIGLVAD